MTKDEKSNWTIKAFPVATRQRVIRAARQRGQPVHEWADEAMIRAVVAQERDGILPPPSGTSLERVPPPKATTLALSYAPAAPVPRTPSVPELAELGRSLSDMIGTVRALSDATQAPIPEIITKRVFRVANRITLRMLQAASQTGQTPLKDGVQHDEL